MLAQVCLTTLLIQTLIRFPGTKGAAPTQWCAVPGDAWTHAEISTGNTDISPGNTDISPGNTDISPGNTDLISECKDTCRTTHNCTFYSIYGPPHGGNTECLCSNDVYELVIASTQCDGRSCCEKGLSAVHTVCDSGTYGITCEYDCSPTCLSHLCDVISGECLIGCEDGWHGAKCERECGNCVDSTCDQISGVCDDGCDLGWFSPACAEPCSVHCLGNSCSGDDGTCHGGCNPGWYKPICSEQCPENCASDVCGIGDGACEQCLGGWFGARCDQQCPERCDRLCDMLTGNCIKDWQYLDGQYWTDQWECPDNCFEARCDNYTKVCDSCNDGFWGDLCDNSCPVNCNGSVCDVDNGECTDGCEIGWDGIQCEIDIDECAEASDDDPPCGSKLCYNTPGSYLCCSEGLVSQPTDKYKCYDSSPPVWVWPVLIIALLAGCVAGGLGHKFYVSNQVTLPWQKTKKEPSTMPMPLPDDIRDTPSPPEAKLATDDEDDVDYEETGDIKRPDPNIGRPLPTPGKHGNDYINRDMVTIIRESSKSEEEEAEIEYESVQQVDRSSKGRYSAIERRLQELENVAYVNK